MKITSSITLIALAAALFAPSHAKAGDKEKALIGGLIGGIIIASALDNNDTSISVGYSNHYGRHGHWEWVSVRTWVPGYHERRRDHCGNLVRVWVSGHYTFVKQKVWVDGGHRSGHYGYRDGHRDHGHGDYRDDRRRRDRYDDDRRDHDRGDDRRRRGSYDNDRGDNDHRQKFARRF